MHMRCFPAWVYVAIILSTSWILFAIMLIVFSDFPFLVISMALTILLMLSALVIALAWAYQNNW